MSSFITIKIYFIDVIDRKNIERINNLVLNFWYYCHVNGCFSLEFDEQIKKQRVKLAFFTLLLNILKLLNILNYLILILILIDINWINRGFLYFFFNLFVRLHSFVYMSIIYIIYLVPIQHKFLVLIFHFNKF